jgi:hypothetical protein
MKTQALLLIGVLLVAGCARPVPVTDTGHGIYSVSEKAFGPDGARIAYGTAFGAAQRFCALRGDALYAVILDAQVRGFTDPAGPGAELRFRCDR